MPVTAENAGLGMKIVVNTEIRLPKIPIIAINAKTMAATTTPAGLRIRLLHDCRICGTSILPNLVNTALKFR